MRVPLFMLLLIGLVVARPAEAQMNNAFVKTPAAVAIPGSGPTNPAVVTAVEQMREQLRSLVVAQERYWAEHGTYTTDLAALGHFPRSRTAAKDSAFAQVIFAGGRGWTGMSSHPVARGKSCVIFVGDVDELPTVPLTRSERRPAANEGEVSCDTP